MLLVREFSESDNVLLYVTVSTGGAGAPPLRRNISTLKSFTTRQLRNCQKNGEISNLPEQIWQRSFHDRVVRDEREFEMVWTYIENNPKKWELDCFYKG